MILSDRIVELRKKNGWSQEELAEKAGVTRQSVSKWESEQSSPDLDKILRLAEIFGVTTDYLLKGDEGDAAEKERHSADPEPAGSKARKARKVTMEEAGDFLAAKEKSIPAISLGVSLCILSPVILIFLTGGAEYGIINADEDKMAMLGVAVLITIIAAAVSMIVFASVKTSKYEYLEKEFIELDYETEKLIKSLKEEFAPEFGRKLVLGVCLCIISVLPLFILGVVFDAEDGFHFVAATCIILIVISIAVNIFVRAGIKHESYETLLEEGDHKREEKDKFLEVVSTVYWLSVTAVYVGYSLITYRWHSSWVIWPVAAIVFVVIREICKAVRNR